MRILMIGTFRPAGRCRGTLSLAGELNRQGHRVTVFYADAPAEAAEKLGRYYRVRLVAGTRPAEITWLLKQESFALIHLQEPSLFRQGFSLAGALNLPVGVTVPAFSADLSPQYLQRAAFVIAFHERIRDIFRPHRKDTVVIPDGIDLSRFHPAPKTGFRLALFQEEGVTRESALAVIKAAALCEIQLDLFGKGKLPRGAGREHGQPPCPAPVLACSAIVAGRGRAVLEGMACGNAVLLLEERYRGLLTPGRLFSPSRPEGSGEEKPCYRTIFNDLARLVKDRQRLQQLQEWGRRWVRENHDLRLSAEMTAQVYARAVR